MSSVALKPDTMKRFVKRIIQKTKDDFNLDAQGAREVAARHLKLAPGTLENLGKGKVKDPRGSIRDRISAAAIPAIHHEIARCINDLEQAIQAGVDPRSPEMAALAREVREAQELIGEPAA